MKSLQINLDCINILKGLAYSQMLVNIHFKFFSWKMKELLLLTQDILMTTMHFLELMLNKLERLHPQILLIFSVFIESLPAKGSVSI